MGANWLLHHKENYRVNQMNSELRPVLEEIKTKSYNYNQDYTEEELKDRQSKGYNIEVNLF